MTVEQRFVATAARGLETLLAAELEQLGAGSVQTRRGAVEFAGGLPLAYRICLWSRVASRVLLPLRSIPAPDGDALYAGAGGVDWAQHLGATGTLAVDCAGQGAIGHTRYAALRVKDAIVDQFRAACGVRPSVDTRRPDVLLHLHLHGETAQLSLDLGGGSLHRRGYRVQGGSAPLKENLAAAILLKAGWPEIAAAGGPLLDPLCGSGTLVLEGASIAADRAPGLLRSHFGFLRWKGFEAAVWEALLEEAKKRFRAGQERMPALVGWDEDPAAVQAARANAAKAGWGEQVRFERRALGQAQGQPPPGDGLLVANPPYGERLEAEVGLQRLYTRLGEDMRRLCPGWRAAVFTGNPRLAGALKLRPWRSFSLFNGPLRCRLMVYWLDKRAESASHDQEEAVKTGPQPTAKPSDGVEMLVNRLKKNLRHLGRWARRQKVDCYRVYDADLPEFALAIDLYRGAETWIHVQEYAPPASVDPDRAKRRRRAALEVLPEVFQIPPTQLYFKTRRRRRPQEQYARMDRGGDFVEVREGAARFWVNFSNYLDTGLFLDHRLVRQRLAGLAVGGRFLNLFGYTGTASVSAALKGAESTTTVDMSRTYLDWAERNMALNSLQSGAHQRLQADCLEWLDTYKGRPFEVIFLNPPTFSNSKRMDRSFDLIRDHPDLLRQAVRLLVPGGVLVFSTHARRFRLEEGALQGVDCTETTAAMVPQDFTRRKAFRCFELRRPV